MSVVTLKYTTQNKVSSGHVYTDNSPFSLGYPTTDYCTYSHYLDHDIRFSIFEKEKLHYSH